MLVILSAEAYARMLKLLLPPGRWNLEPDSNLSRLFLANGDELARVSARAADLVEEAAPRTTDELLPEWERMLDLPSTGDLAERRARIVAHLLSQRGVRPVDYQEALAGLLGQDAGDVVVIERGRAFAITVGDDREIYRFFIYRDPDLPGDYFLDSAQAAVDLMSHSHTKGLVIESIAMLCDDEFSLCDRDLLGGEPSFTTRNSARAAFREATGRNASLLCLGHEQTAWTGGVFATFKASGDAALSDITGTSGDFGASAYDLDGSGGARWTLDSAALGGVPAAESRAYFVIYRARSGTGAIVSKQVLPGEGWMLFHNITGPFLLGEGDAEGAVARGLTSTSVTLDAWRCLGWAADRDNAEVRFSSDLESASDAALVAERFDPPGRALMVGANGFGSMDCEVAVVAETVEDVATLDLQTACAALLARFLGS